MSVRFILMVWRERTGDQYKADTNLKAKEVWLQHSTVIEKKL